MSWINPRNWLGGRETDDAGLDELLREERRIASEVERVRGLSDAARARILSEVTRPTPQKPFWPPLFAPTTRLLVAGGLPLILAVAMIALVERSAGTAPVEALGLAPSPATVQVAKVGGRVEFTISNGQRSHFVSRSTVPDRFDASRRVRMTDGAYADNLDDGTALVFYRID